MSLSYVQSCVYHVHIVSLTPLECRCHEVRDFIFCSPLHTMDMAKIRLHTCSVSNRFLFVLWTRLTLNLLCSQEWPWTPEAPSSTSQVLRLTGIYYHSPLWVLVKGMTATNELLEVIWSPGYYTSSGSAQEPRFIFFWSIAQPLPLLSVHRWKFNTVSW